MNFTFDLTEPEASLILAALSKQPYELVHALIAKLQAQGNKQVADQGKLRAVE